MILHPSFFGGLLNTHSAYIVDLSKLEEGRLHIDESDFDLHEMIANIANITKTQIESKHEGNVQFEFKMEQNVPRIVCGDAERVLQMVYNLLSNACKYTEQGFVKFSISGVDFAKATADGLINLPASQASTRDQENETDFSMSLLQNAEEGVDLPTEICQRDGRNKFVLKIEVRKLTFASRREW